MMQCEGRWINYACYWRFKYFRITAGVNSSLEYAESRLWDSLILGLDCMVFEQ